MGPGQLDRRLVGLGAAVAEEALAAERPLGECLGERSLGFHVPGIGHVDQLPDLVANRLDDPGRAMAEQVAAPAREEVEVAVPFGIPDPRAFAPDQTDRVPPVIGDHIPIELGDRLLRALVGELSHEPRLQMNLRRARGQVQTTSAELSDLKPDETRSAASTARPGSGRRPGSAIRVRGCRRRTISVPIAALGEDLQQQRVPSRPSMMCVLRTPASRLQAGLHLGDHPLVDHASGDQVAAVFGSQTRDQAPGSLRSIRMPGVSVRKTSFSALKRQGDGGGGGVGVDVKQLPSSSSSSASEGSTGTTPARQRFSIGMVSTSVTSPTRPRSIRLPRRQEA